MVKAGWTNNVRNVNLLVDSAICLANEITSIVQELVLEVAQEPIVADDNFRKRQLLLRGFEIELDVQFLEEGCDGILILILLCLDYFDDFANGISHARREGCTASNWRSCGFSGKDRRSCQVSENPR